MSDQTESETPEQREARETQERMSQGEVIETPIPDGSETEEAPVDGGSGLTGLGENVESNDGDGEDRRPNSGKDSDGETSDETSE